MFFENASAAWMAHYGGVSQIVYSELLDELAPWLNPSTSFLPDIVLDRNNRPRRFNNISIHEMTHSSHFTNVDIFWYQALTQQEFDNGGHGDGSEPNAGYVAVAESWGNHIENYFFENTMFYNSNLDDVDYEQPPFGSGITPWIPDGIHYDLIDNRESVTTIIDNIEGFNNTKIFSILNEDTRSMNEMEINLWEAYNAHPGVIMTQSDLMILFNSYGF